MSKVFKFDPKDNAYRWHGARSRRYADQEDVQGVVENWLIGKNENAQNFAVRYYEVDVGGFSHAEQHPHDHGVLILRGKAHVILGDEEFDVEPMDVIYIHPNHFHQLINTGDEPMGFLCIIPAHRPKRGEMVWAEEGIEDLETS
jgi:quercetin dioxygenase-like cupin family protein